MGEASGIREPASSDMFEMQAGTEPLRQTKLRQARGMRTNEACTGQLAVKALVAGRQAGTRETDGFQVGWLGQGFGVAAA